jgi:hypothetical protein
MNRSVEALPLQSTGWRHSSPVNQIDHKNVGPSVESQTVLSQTHTVWYISCMIYHDHVISTLRLQHVIARRAQEEQDFIPTSVGDSGRGGGRKWRGLVTYLRLIMCLLQDNVKRRFLTRANARSRQELDSRNSVNR